MIGSISSTFQMQYGQSLGISGLHYVPQAIGLMIGSQIPAFLNDRIYRALSTRYASPGRPEFRLPLMMLGSLFTPIGLLWYGWSAEAHAPWIVPDLGLVLQSTAGMLAFNSIQLYIVDAYTLYAASAIAAASFLRSLCGFAFPLFERYLYETLGVGWANSALALCAFVIGLPSPWLFWVFGERLRGRSVYAAGGD